MITKDSSNMCWFSGMRCVGFLGCDALVFWDAMRWFSGMRCVGFLGCDALVFWDAMRWFSGMCLFSEMLLSFVTTLQDDYKR
jgi:hypothetical protein